MPLAQYPKYPDLESFLFHLPPSIGFSAQKSDMILPLIVFLATYFRSNSTNRINHLDSLPLKVVFSNKYFNGSIQATTHIWKGRIMCLDFSMTHTRAKHDLVHNHGTSCSNSIWLSYSYHHLLM